MPGRDAYSGLNALLDTVPGAPRASSPPDPGSAPVEKAAPVETRPTPPAPPSPAAGLEKGAAAASSPTPAAAEPTAASAPPVRRRPSARPRPAPARAPAPATGSGPVEKFSLKLPAGLTDRARDVAYWVPGTTLTDLVVQGLETVIDEYQRLHNAGQPFPPRRGPVRAGRPLGRHS
jgi:hypothetical protein